MGGGGGELSKNWCLTLCAPARRSVFQPALLTFPALVALSVMVAPADAASSKAARPAIPAVETAPREAGEPIMAIVSIKSQNVTFYDADGWIARAPVSTGVKGRETPAGVFAVIEKDKDHHSTMYDDAWMPNMQRITWNGLALHGGPLPGYAASHGCIRMPYAFAEEMFDKTRIGMRVIVSPNDAAPVDISHPALLVPDAEAIAAAPARADTLASAAAAAVEAARQAKEASVTAAREAKSAAALLRKLEQQRTRADTRVASAEKALAGAERARAKAEDLRQQAAANVADLASQLEVAMSDAKTKDDAVAAANEAVTAADALASANDGVEANADALTTASVVVDTDVDPKEIAASAARDAKAAAAAVAKLEASKARADKKLASAEKALAAADQAKAHAEDLQQKAIAKAAELATQVETAGADAKAAVDAAAAAKEAAKVAAAEKPVAAAAASEAKLLLEPVSIYISRATQKLYVRRNTHAPARDGGGEVFDSSIEVPVTIRDPETPIGTHVFTAMASGEDGLRWTAVTVDDADNATDALDRITIPQEVLDRIAPTALPRSSIVISDEPLSKETNYRTEYVAVLSDQPQGGFLTRKPTVIVAEKPVLLPPPRVRFFSLFQRN